MAEDPWSRTFGSQGVYGVQHGGGCTGRWRCVYHNPAALKPGIAFPLTLEQCFRVAGIRAAATLVVLDVARAFQVTRIKVECFRDERFVKARRVNPKNFFAELKRRNVYKVAVAYAIVGWLVMQIAATVVPALHLSDAITSTVVLLVILGFPIALIFAWAFELTPEGWKRTEDVDLSKSITHKTGRKLDFIIIAVLLLVISILLFQCL